MAFHEKKFDHMNGTTITYIEDPYPIENYRGERKLIIIFQSLGDEKSSDDDKRYPYTLLAGLKHFNVRKIYIKDDHGMVGDYYLGINGTLNTKDAVIYFINEKIKEYKLLKEDVIMLGFSKGGYAALLFSHEIGVGAAICAIPQFDLVKWIDKFKSHLSYIYPKEASDSDKEFYSEHLGEVIRRTLTPPGMIYLVTSRNDETYSDHIPHLIDAINYMKRSKLIVFHNDEMYVTRHNNVVKNSLNEIMFFISSELVSSRLKNNM